MKKVETKSITGIKNLTRSNIEYILELAEKLEPIVKGESQLQPLKGKKLCTFFYEPSTRTRLSFESAMLSLGGTVISMADAQKTSSVWKGETLKDTIKTIENFADVIALRHFQAGAAEEADSHSRVPIINAGDGPNEHPTQTLLDMLTIKKEKGRLDNLKVAIVGDLKHTRSAHSLTLGLSNFDNIEFVFISPESFKTNQWIKDIVLEKGNTFVESEDLENSIIDVDVIYMCRIQAERIEDPAEFAKIDGLYDLTRKLVDNCTKKPIVLHHLPRVKELSEDVDDYEGAAYFKQTYNGVLVRGALLTMVLDKVPVEYNL